MKQNQHSAYYEAFKSKDVRFDGRIFIGVSSTGIYCRPICKAKLPKEENCAFYVTAAEAERAGYRPCLLCRPELAPAHAQIHTSRNIAYRAMKIINENISNHKSLAEIAHTLKITDRHLRRIFHEEFHVTPIEYVQTHRLLLAKNLLTDSNLSIIDVAFASGFASSRRFNDLFQTHYKLAPRDFRKGLVHAKRKDHEIHIKIGYRPPFRYLDIIRFLQQRAIKGIETIISNHYIRTIHIKKDQTSIYGYLIVANDEIGHTLQLTLSNSLLQVIPQVIEKVKHVFDVYCDPNVVYDSLKDMQDILPTSFRIGTRIPGSIDDFELCVRAIVGQLVSVKSATTILTKLVEQLGVKLAYGTIGISYAFPTSKRICEIKDDITDILGPLGITKSKAVAIKHVAELFESENIDYATCGNPLMERSRLLEIKGIGTWTANYIAMRAMNDTDVFLNSDYVIKKLCKTYHVTSEMFNKYRPWRSYITMCLWQFQEEQDKQKEG